MIKRKRSGRLCLTLLVLIFLVGLMPVTQMKTFGMDEVSPPDAAEFVPPMEEDSEEKGGELSRGQNLSSVDVEVIGRYAYTGSPVIPQVKVTLDGVTLSGETDYTLSARNNVEAGTATGTIEGIGSYTGRKNFDFTIEKAMPTDAPDAPSLFCQSATGFTIDMQKDMEYIVRNEEDDPIVSDLSAEGMYYGFDLDKEINVFNVYGRYKETKNYLPSEYSAPLKVEIHRIPDASQGNRLPQPENISFDGYRLSWNPQPHPGYSGEEDIWYNVVCYRKELGYVHETEDGYLYGNGYMCDYSGVGDFFPCVSIDDSIINKSGTYIFALSVHDGSEIPEEESPGGYYPSKPVICTYPFEKPDQALRPPTDPKWLVQDGKIFMTVKDDHPDNAGKQRAAAPYEYWIYEDGVAKWAWLGGSGTSRLLPYSLDADKQYTFRVKVKSKDIRQWYHSDWSEFSSPLDTGETTEPIATTLENILQSLENGTLSSADARLKMSRLDKEDLLVALQSNVRLWDTISEIERIYMEKQNITGEVEIAPEFAGKLEGDVRIIGAGMNTSGKRFSLKIGDGKNQVTVPNRFTQYVHLSIELEGPPQPHQLFDLPIRITMPIPKPLRPQSLYLLHYKDEDPTQFEMVRLEHNGDGTVSFTLSHLSDFVFASEEAPDLYEIQVIGGRSYLEDGTAVGKAAAGKKVTLKADGAAEGKEFDRWIVVKGQITLADEKDETTTFTMPSEDVAVRALWKDKAVTPDGGKNAPDEKIGASKKPGSTVSSTPKTEDGADRSLGMGLILASLLILLSTAFVGGKEM